MVRDAYGNEITQGCIIVERMVNPHTNEICYLMHRVVKVYISPGYPNPDSNEGTSPGQCFIEVALTANPFGGGACTRLITNLKTVAVVEEVKKQPTTGVEDYAEEDKYVPAEPTGSDECAADPVGSN